jgi:CHAD domain-containing protein
MSLDQQRIHSLFRKLARQSAKLADKPQPHEVHQFRTATRRVQAVLEELVPEPDRNQRRLLKQLARLRRRAGRVRDLDVQIAALRGLKLSEAPGRKTQVLRTLIEIRSKREKKLADGMDTATLRELRNRLKRAEAKLKVKTKDFDPLVRALRMFARVSAAQATLNEDVLHKYRLAGKRIRYIAELATNRAEAQPMIAQLQAMQDALGEWHDWLTLAGTVRNQAGNVPHSGLLAAVNNITRAKLRDAMQAVAETKAALLPKPVVKKSPGVSSTRGRSEEVRVQSATAAA